MGEGRPLCTLSCVRICVRARVCARARVRRLVPTHGLGQSACGGQLLGRLPFFPRLFGCLAQIGCLVGWTIGGAQAPFIALAAL